MWSSRLRHAHAPPDVRSADACMARRSAPRLVPPPVLVAPPIIVALPILLLLYGTWNGGSRVSVSVEWWITPIGGMVDVLPVALRAFTPQSMAHWGHVTVYVSRKNMHRITRIALARRGGGIHAPPPLCIRTHVHQTRLFFPASLTLWRTSSRSTVQAQGEESTLRASCYL